MRTHPRSNNRSGILPVIRSVKNRWRLRILVSGASLVLGAGLVAFLVSAWGLELLRFSPGAVTFFRVLAWLTVVAVAAVFLVRPLLRRVSDEQVALYLEEHEPSLEAAILGAVEVERRARAQSANAVITPLEEASPELLRRLVERAVEKVHAVEEGRRIDQRRIYRSTGALGALAFASLALLLFAPSSIRHGVSALLLPVTDAAAVSPYSIEVDPGDVTIARGSDQFVSARLQGFQAEDVSLFTRGDEAEGFQRISMLPLETGDGFELLLFAVQEETSYFVESNGVRSPTFVIRVEDLPYVERLEQEYRYPAYTGLEPRLVERGGDVVALLGTVVSMTVHPTMATAGGRLVVDDEQMIPLEPGAEGTLTADLEVEGRGVFRVELAAADGTLITASPTYTIDVLLDLPPSVHFERPGRDTPASPIEEVYLEARADDDYGVARLQLVYSVNGAPEDTISLFGGARAAPTKEVTAGHTIFMEEYGLEPGDVVTYYAIARDNNRAGARDVKSDLYFLNVRPFGREYRQAEQMGGGGGMGGGQAGAEAALSELQRQVISATFNLARDRESLDPRAFAENTTSVGLAQGRVRAQVETLTQRMVNRGLAGADESFKEIAELLPQSIEDMKAAEELLEEQNIFEAMAPEQRALRVLLKAEETYERYVGQQQGGVGGGGGGANADDLADLFELELDKLRNQYETVQRGAREQANNEVDEVLEKLKELARRQQQEAERQRQRAARSGGSGSAEGQRSLADETEEAARQLERLSRETGQAELEETARRLQQAADAMRRSAGGSGNAGMAESAAALDRLEEARRRLERAQEDRGSEGAQEALDRVRRLGENQRQVQEDFDDLSDDDARRREQVQQLVERKEEMLRETEDIERQLDRLAQDVRRDSPQAGRALGEGAEQIRESKLKEKISFSRGVVQQRDQEYARVFEEQIANDIAELERTLEGAASATGQPREDRELEQSLERASDLVRGMESLERRLQSGQQGDPSGEGQQQGQEGQQQGGEGQGGRRLDPGAGQPNDQGGGAGGGGPEGFRDGGRNIGDPDPLGGSTRGWGRPFTEEEIRQYQREFSERTRDAEALRQELMEQGRDVGDLDRAIEALRNLQNVRVYGDLRQVALLQEAIQESLKQVEFALRRDVEGKRENRVFLSGSDDVPAGFRELVEEYYRSLARSGGG